jgi:hypothetical protein
MQVDDCIPAKSFLYVAARQIERGMRIYRTPIEVLIYITYRMGRP